MDHAGHGQNASAANQGTATSGGEHAGHHMPEGDSTAHAHHDMSGMPHGAPLTHPASESGNPLLDMQTTMPAARLDDPGIGLRDNGRRVLTYAHLHSVFPDPDGREPGRTIELHLTGHMMRFAWSFDGTKFSDAEPIALRYGERLRIVLVNDTMMTHPIHLHGHFFELVNGQDRQPLKHTVNVAPGGKVAFDLTASEPGDWAFHCHLLLHMHAGMFNVVTVRPLDGEA